MRRAPSAATWLLKLFCSGSEYDSVIGDLTEQYQRGHGSLWYWRQVLAIVVLDLYRKPGRGSLIRPNRIPIGAIFAGILLIVALSAVLLTGIWPIFAFGVVGGIIFGILKFLRRDEAAGPGTFNTPAIVRIDSSKITIGGGMGAGILILMLLTGVLHDLPILRILATPGLLAGLLFALVLRVWRKNHPPAPRVVSLGLTGNTSANEKSPSNEAAIRGNK